MDQWSSLYVRLGRKGLAGGWEGSTLEGHLGAVTALAVSRDGRHILSGSADWTLKLWEVATGQCLRTLEGHASAITAVCLSADGRHALSGSVDRALRYWDLVSGRCLATLEGHRDVVASVALSADGRHALSGGADRTIRLWELAGGRCLRTLEAHADPIHSVALSADGRLALSGSAQFLIRNESERLFTTGELKLWDVARGRCLPTFEGHADAVTAVCLSAEGRYALSGGGRSVVESAGGKSPPSQLHLWEVASGRRLMTFTGHADAITSVCLSSEGRYALSGSTDKTLKLWETATGRCLRSFEGHTEAVTSVGFSSDGRHAVSGSADQTLKLWVLDWELADNPPVPWDEGARPYLEVFLTQHTPYAASLPPERKRTVKEIVNLPLGRLFGSAAPTERQVRQALTRQGKPVWTEEDFEGLLYTLGCAGYGWLRPEGVRRKLEQMARKWQGPPSVPPG
jgi:WD40 repeat protein